MATHAERNGIRNEMNLGIDLPRGEVLTARGFARLLVMAADRTFGDKERERTFLQSVAEVLDAACPALCDEGKQHAASWSLRVTDQLESVIDVLGKD